VTQTTCVNDELAKEMQNRDKGDDQVMGTKKSAINLHRVDSHLLALRKKKTTKITKRRANKGSGCQLKIITYLNGLTKDEAENDFECVGVVQ
jgi:hypothetical protein